MHGYPFSLLAAVKSMFSVQSFNAEPEQAADKQGDPINGWVSDAPQLMPTLFRGLRRRRHLRQPPATSNHVCQLALPSSAARCERGASGVRARYTARAAHAVTRGTRYEPTPGRARGRRHAFYPRNAGSERSCRHLVPRSLLSVVSDRTSTSTRGLSSVSSWASSNLGCSQGTTTSG